MSAKKTALSDKDLKEHIGRIISGPMHAEKEFVTSGYTYKDVYEMASGLRSSLSSFDQDNSSVCLCAENKAVIAAALLASIAGAPPLILPYAYSPQVLTEMHGLTGFEMAVTDASREFPPGVKTIIPEHCRGVESNLFCEMSVDLNGELLKLYTGGSTGKPRIWTKTLKNLFLEAIYLSRKYDISHRDRFVATVSPYHIYGLLFSVIIPLVSSASVLGDIYSLPQEIISAIKDGSPTVLVSVPMHYRALRGHSTPASSLRIAFSSAGVLDPADSDDFHRRTGLGVIEVYGSTETGGIASMCRAEGESAFTPFDNIDWRIVDERLHVRSDFVSPEIERAPDGFVATCDRTRRHDGNSFLLLGRSDTVVKVAGKRVDLEEVRSKLNEVPGVRDCVVISLPVHSGRENAIAALVEGNLGKADVVLSLSDVLEPYAMPRSIKIVDNMPYTTAGKYDKKVIEEMFRSEFGQLPNAQWSGK
jgi:acyl-coenzyme A synthetase/AMP-(fatty) acid ligase